MMNKEMKNNTFYKSLQNEMNELFSEYLGEDIEQIYSEFSDVDEDIVNELIKGACDNFLKELKQKYEI